MKKFVLDTGILLHYIRESPLSHEIEKTHQLMSQDSIPIIPVVVLGEMEGFMQRQSWGEKKITYLKKLLKKMPVIDIHGKDETLLKTYATLRNYSKNALPGKKLGRSIGIGQNDIWIASIAKVSGAELITTDSDFDHLNGEWLTVHKF